MAEAYGNYGASGRMNVFGAMADAQKQKAKPYNEMIAMLQKGAAGQGPSAAGILGQSMLEQQQRQLMGSAAGATGSGVSPGLAFRTGAQQAGQAGLEAQAQFMAMRAQEQQQYQQMLAETLLGARGQDLGLQQAKMGQKGMFEKYVAPAIGGAAMGGAMALSDERLKTAIKTASGPYHLIGLRDVSWDWRPEAAKYGCEGRASGVIAQEVQKLFPAAGVSLNGYLAVNYNELDRLVAARRV